MADFTLDDLIDHLQQLQAQGFGSVAIVHEYDTMIDYEDADFFQPAVLVTDPTGYYWHDRLYTLAAAEQLRLLSPDLKFEPVLAVTNHWTIYDEGEL
jgi:hypothetical protein